MVIIIISWAAALDHPNKTRKYHNIDKILWWSNYPEWTPPVLPWSGWVVSKMDGWMDGWTLLEMGFFLFVFVATESEIHSYTLAYFSAVLHCWAVENVCGGGAQAGNVMFQKQAGPQNEFWEHEISRNWQSNQRVARTDQQPTQIYFGHFELWAIKVAFTGLYIMQCRSNDSPRIEPLCY